MLIEIRLIQETRPLSKIDRVIHSKGIHRNHWVAEKKAKLCFLKFVFYKRTLNIQTLFVIFQ